MAEELKEIMDKALAQAKADYHLNNQEADAALRVLEVFVNQVLKVDRRYGNDSPDSQRIINAAYDLIAAAARSYRIEVGTGRAG